jgi:Sulfotransferase domain
MNKPNFFIIGAPKCGTTAFSEYLRTHPCVFFSNPKELHYFNSDHGIGRLKTLPEYLSYFAAAEPHHQAIGEGSVLYLFSRVAVARINAFNPQARFIVMLRNPLELAYAWHSQALSGSAEMIDDFERAWRMQDARRHGRHVPKWCPDRRLLLYGEIGLLGRQLARLFETVSRDRVHVILFEDFIANTPQVYEDAVRFLDLPFDGRRDFPRINENKRLKSARLASGLRNLGWLKARLGLQWNTGLLGAAGRWNTAQLPRKPLSETFAAELRDYFTADIGTLSRLIDRDLSHWSGGA